MSTQTSLPPQVQAMSVADEQAAIALVDVTKRYNLRPVLRSISYTLNSGKTLALLGPNGAGKTTLLRILATLAKPTQGHAIVAGHDAAEDANAVRQLIGYVGHQPLVYDDLTGLENLLFFARMYGLADGPERARVSLERVGLRAKANDRVRTYSRGQAQRLALARGLLHRPEVLLLDEPDTGLDDAALELLGAVLQERREKQLTTIFTTHQLERGLQQSDETVVLVAGRIAYAGAAVDITVGEVRQMYGQQVRRAL